MRDWLAVELTGAVRAPKARVLYHDGTFKVFNKEGLVTTFTGSNPEKRKGWRRSWVAETERGTMFMRGLCIACGGWARVAARRQQELWNGEARKTAEV